MSEFDKGYYARRAAEEAELALATDDQEAAEAHRKLQRAYIERASVGGATSSLGSTFRPPARSSPQRSPRSMRYDAGSSGVALRM